MHVLNTNGAQDLAILIESRLHASHVMSNPVRLSFICVRN